MRDKNRFNRERFVGYENLFSSKSDPKAIEKTKENIEWLATKEERGVASFPRGIKFFQSPADKISEKISKNYISAIVAKPYLDPLFRGNEPEEKIRQTISELEDIYLKSFT